MFLVFSTPPSEKLLATPPRRRTVACEQRVSKSRVGSAGRVVVGDWVKNAATVVGNGDDGSGGRGRLRRRARVGVVRTDRRISRGAAVRLPVPRSTAGDLNDRVGSVCRRVSVDVSRAVLLSLVDWSPSDGYQHAREPDNTTHGTSNPSRPSDRRQSAASQRVNDTKRQRNTTRTSAMMSSRTTAAVVRCIAVAVVLQQLADTASG